jgi:hypothetical protein
MARDQRHTRRTRLDRRCWIAAGDNQPRHECLIEDISETGARIALPAGATLPKTVDLHLTSVGAVIRKSEVVWQTATEAGLHFLDRPQMPGTPRLVDQVTGRSS